MKGVSVSIVRFVDMDFPGFVECRLVDAAGVEHRFVEKIPVVSTEDLWLDTAYPCPGVIACVVVAEHDGDPATVTIDTEQSWGVESVDGATRFHILRRDLIEL